MHVMAIPTFQLRLPPLMAERDCPLTMEAMTLKPVTVAAFKRSGIATAYNLKFQVSAARQEWGVDRLTQRHILPESFALTQSSGPVSP